MNVIVDFTIIPIGVGISLSPYIAACEKILRSAPGVTADLHANGTNIEGEWDDVFAAVRRCHDELHRMGAPRIFSTIHAGTRTDRKQSMEDKIRSVNQKLEE
jgi:uncharacterized protein (TIGR00106 family)